jgi:hypothetical protein
MQICLDCKDKTIKFYHFKRQAQEVHKQNKRSFMPSSQKPKKQKRSKVVHNIYKIIETYADKCSIGTIKINESTRKLVIEPDINTKTSISSINVNKEVPVKKSVKPKKVRKDESEDDDDDDDDPAEALCEMEMDEEMNENPMCIKEENFNLPITFADALRSDDNNTFNDQTNDDGHFGDNDNNDNDDGSSSGYNPKFSVKKESLKKKVAKKRPSQTQLKKPGNATKKERPEGMYNNYKTKSKFSQVESKKFFLTKARKKDCA